MQTILLKHNDCVLQMKTIGDNTISAIITDPPYLIGFMSRNWDKVPTVSITSATPTDPDETDDESISSDDIHAMEVFHIAWLQEAFRILQPGGIAKVFAATRTQHRLAAAMEAVGFILEPEHSIEAWTYGCLSADTEILTKEGWKLGVDINVGESVACWDPKTEAVHFDSVLGVTKEPLDGNMVGLKSDFTDQLLTLNHRVYHRYHQGWIVHPAEFLVDTISILPVVANASHKVGQTEVTGVLEAYKGMVWCVKVPTGAFVARRKGMAFATGNSGFPKSLNVEKAIDNFMGKSDDREIIGMARGVGGENMNDIVAGRDVIRTTEDPGGKGVGAYGTGAKQVAIDIPITAPATEEAKQFSGYGTALKPAYEPFIVGRKPL